MYDPADSTHCAYSTICDMYTNFPYRVGQADVRIFFNSTAKSIPKKLRQQY